MSAAERDRIVDEQRASARLVRLDPGTAPGTTAELDAYMTEMLPHLAYVTKTRFMREMMVPPRLPFTPEGLVQLVITRAAADLPDTADAGPLRLPLAVAQPRGSATGIDPADELRRDQGAITEAAPGVAGAVGDARLRQGRLALAGNGERE